VRALAWLALAAGATGCPRTAFHCDTAHPCDVDGAVCVATNQCAAPATSCASGLAYDRSAEHPGECVDATALDASARDAAGDVAAQ
jgi:hypothetical protein